MTIPRTVVAIVGALLCTVGTAQGALAIADRLSPGLLANATGAPRLGLQIDVASVLAFLVLVWWWLDPILLRAGLGRAVRFVITTLVAAVVPLGAFALPIAYVGFFAALGTYGAASAVAVLEILAVAPVIGWGIAFWLVELLGGFPIAHVEPQAERPRRRTAP